MFRIRPFESRTISWWYDQKDQIDIAPHYQRKGSIWTDHSRSYLIDSILNDFDLPKFYVADFTYADSSLNIARKPYAIIDGKQRLESIFGFYEGGTTLARDFILHSDPTIDLGGLSYRDLRQSFPKVASKFDNFNLSVMSVITDDEPKINELFLRLNSSRPLSAAEYRNAMHGVGPSLVREISKDDFLSTYVGFSKKRGEDQQVATKFLLVEFRGDLVDTKKKQLDKLFEEAARAEASDGEFDRAKSRVIDNLAEMRSVFIPGDPLLRSQGPLVVYYWLIRSIGSQPGLRKFLLDFEADRKSNREKAKSHNTSNQIDQDLLQYDALNRSINDVGSLQGRYRILLNRYLKQKNAESKSSNGPVR